VMPSYKVTEKLISKGGGYQTFEITDVAKRALEDESCDVESHGILFSGDGEINSYRIFSSHDNSLFPPFQEITFYELPKDFTAYKK